MEAVNQREGKGSSARSRGEYVLLDLLVGVTAVGERDCRLVLRALVKEREEDDEAMLHARVPDYADRRARIDCEPQLVHDLEDVRFAEDVVKVPRRAFAADLQRAKVSQGSLRDEEAERVVMASGKVIDVLLRALTRVVSIECTQGKRTGRTAV